MALGPALVSLLALLILVGAFLSAAHQVGSQTGCLHTAHCCCSSCATDHDPP